MLGLLSFNASADYKTMIFPYYNEAKADKKCTDNDLISPTIISQDLDAYLNIDRIESNSVSLKKGFIGIIIAPDKNKNSGFIRIYMKLDKTVNAIRAAVRGNNFHGNETNKEMLKVKINDKYQKIDNLPLSTQSNKNGSFKQKLTPKEAPTPIVCVEVEVPYIEGIDNELQITEISLVYDPADVMIVSKFEFPEKNQTVLLGSDYKLQSISSIPDVAGCFATWTSSNPEIVEIDEDNNVNLKKEGTATITAQIKNHHCFMDSEPISYELTVTKDDKAAVEDLDSSQEIKWVYFDFNGTRLEGKPTAPGIYIRKANGRSEKILIK